MLRMRLNQLAQHLSNGEWNFTRALLQHVHNENDFRPPLIYDTTYTIVTLAAHGIHISSSDLGAKESVEWEK